MFFTLLFMLLTSATAWAETVETFYLDADGTRHNVTATVLDGTETDLAAGTYIATGTLNYTNTTTVSGQTFALRLTGNVTLILADGCTMNIGTSENRIDGNAIHYSGTSTLTIYAQSTGNDMGTLSCYNSSLSAACIRAYEITINGGNVIADAGGEQAIAFYANNSVTRAVFTINGGNVTARASGTHSYANAIYAAGYFEFNGGTLTTSTNGGYAIYSSKRRYTFTWRHPTDRITISSGGFYVNNTATATFNKLFSSDTNYYGGTFTGSDINTALAGKTLSAYAVPYLDENGDTQTCSDYKLLTETTTVISSAPGWCVAFGTLNFTNSLRLGTNVNLILMDGCQMNFGTSESRLERQAITISSGTPSLTIYGQTQGSGTLSVYNTGTSRNGITSGAITINGGTVIVDSDGESAKALYAQAGNITINGGTVSATGGAQGIVAETGNIILGCRNNTDRIYASSYSASGTVSVASGKTLYDGNGDSYTGTLTNEQIAAIANKTLRPYDYRTVHYDGNSATSGTMDDQIIAANTDVNLTANAFTRTGYSFTGWNTAADGSGTGYSNGQSVSLSSALTLYAQWSPLANIALAANQVDDNYWTTFYCGDAGYKIDNEENACAYTATYSESTLTLHKLGKVIPQSTAVIIVGEDNSISMTASTDEAENSVSNNLHGVDERTLTSTLGTGTFYVMSKQDDDFGFFEYTADYLPARKAYLLVSGGAAQVKSLAMVFEENATSIHNSQFIIHNETGGWYSLDGRKLNGKPTKSGIYVHDGRKEVLK